MEKTVHYGDTIDSNVSPNELGIVLCKYCSSMVGTLPTNGFKKLYGVCESEICQGENRKGNGYERQARI